MKFPLPKKIFHFLKSLFSGKFFGKGQKVVTFFNTRMVYSLVINIINFIIIIIISIAAFWHFLIYHLQSSKH